MKLKGIEFGRVTGASGVQGFFGEGYWFHRLPFGPDFRGVGFTAKTTTLFPQKGNMPLTGAYRPKEWLPECIHVNRKHDVALNAVGLSGPGAEILFATGLWQEHRRPFTLSFMSVQSKPEERMDELRNYVRLLKFYRDRMQAPFALQVNFTCPNVEHHAADVVAESEEAFGLVSTLGIPTLGKYNTNLPPADGVRISENPRCDALCISNTLKWAEIPEQERYRMFGTLESPLQKFGGGGISGSYLFPRLVRWLQQARAAGLRKPVNAGGGILSLVDAESVLDLAPADSSVFLGSVAFLHPRRVRQIARGLNK